MPIVQSLLDTDFYKFTMGHWVFKRYPNVPVRYAFKNRTARVPLAEYIDAAELRRELDHVRTLCVNPSELHYPPYELECVDGTYRLEFPGVWCETIYWETLALSILNELYYRVCMERL